MRCNIKSIVFFDEPAKLGFGLDPKRQVPMSKTLNVKYLIIGNGRLAKHLRQYFSLLNISAFSWDRSQSLPALHEQLALSTHVLFAISDSAIEAFIKSLSADFSELTNKKLIHFSGALNVSNTISCHPLMSFGHDLYPLEVYQKMHFTITGAQDLSSALPGLANTYSILSAEKKALYHAWCVFGGNLPVILWSKMSAGLRELGVPEKSENLYLEQVLKNYLEQGEKSLTGPLARKDYLTIEKNKAALPVDDRKIYSAFEENYL